MALRVSSGGVGMLVALGGSSYYLIAGLAYLLLAVQFLFSFAMVVTFPYFMPFGEQLGCIAAFTGRA